MQCSAAHGAARTAAWTMCCRPEADVQPALQRSADDALAAEAVAAAQPLLLVEHLAVGRVLLWLTAHISRTAQLPVSLDVNR